MNARGPLPEGPFLRQAQYKRQAQDRPGAAGGSGALSSVEGKALAAICRIWGNGTAVRGFTYVDDLVGGIYLLMQLDLDVSANIGTEEYVTVTEAQRICVGIDWH